MLKTPQGINNPVTHPRLVQAWREHWLANRELFRRNDKGWVNSNHKELRTIFSDIKYMTLGIQDSSGMVGGSTLRKFVDRFQAEWERGFIGVQTQDEPTIVEPEPIKLSEDPLSTLVAQHSEAVELRDSLNETIRSLEIAIQLTEQSINLVSLRARVEELQRTSYEAVDIARNAQEAVRQLNAQIHGEATGV